MRLIDADEFDYVHIGATAYVRAKDIMTAKTVDAVPVVRCRDCKHYEWTANRVPEEQTWWCYKHNTEMGNNDYYSYGVKKDGDGNG